MVVALLGSEIARQFTLVQRFLPFDDGDDGMDRGSVENDYRHRRPPEGHGGGCQGGPSRPLAAITPHVH